MRQPDRHPFLAGNWKMHKTIAEATQAARELSNLVGIVRDRVQIAVAPTFTALYAVAKQLEGSNVAVAGQDCHWEPQGAFTGEVSAAMLKDAGAAFVIIGHSERRQHFHETDVSVNKKVGAALKAGLTPIVCVGETLEEREGGRTLDVVHRQLRGGLAGFAAGDIGHVVLAYEPVWAIGTGKTATSAQAQEVHSSIRVVLTEMFSGKVALGVRIQYGGSVKPENIAELMAKPDIDGALVGGASLKPEDFAKIVKAAQGT
jgi:triosephosphate isomerase